MTGSAPIMSSACEAMYFPDCRSNLYNIPQNPAAEEHMVPNALYDAADDMTDNLAYNAVEKEEGADSPPQGEEYEMVEAPPVVVGEDGYSKLSTSITVPTAGAGTREEESGTARAGQEKRSTGQYDVPTLKDVKGYSHLQYK